MMKKCIFLLPFVMIMPIQSMESCFQTMLSKGLRYASYATAMVSVGWAAYHAVPFLRDGVCSTLSYSDSNDNVQCTFGYHQSLTVSNNQQNLYIGAIPISVMFTHDTKTGTKQLNIGGKIIDQSSITSGSRGQYIRPIQIPQYQIAVAKKFILPFACGVASCILEKCATLC